VSTLHDEPLLPDLIISALNRFEDEPCIHLGDQILSYGDVRRQTSQLIQALQKRGVGRGTHLAVLSKNRPEVLTNLAAAMINGSVITPLHPMGSLEDHAYVIGAAKIECLVIDVDHFSRLAADLKARFPDLIVLSFGPSDVGDDYLALASTFEPQPLVAPRVGPGDPCTLAYTGGTTGLPKGVLLPQRVWSNLTFIQMAEWEFPREVRMLVATPLSHAAMTLLGPVLLHGGSFHVMESFSPDGFFDLVEQRRITTTMIVPVMLYALQSQPRYRTADMSSMETIFYGASPMSPPKLADAIKLWGPIFFQFYGQSEAPMVIAHMKKADHDLSKPERLASCGRPAPWVHVALLGPDNQPVAPGESGEICARGPLVMIGYHDMDVETTEALSADWLHTGDVGRFDEDGFLYIVDRTKDMVITGGFNVFPREVEDVISSHAAVNTVIVVGVPDEKWGEAVKAVVVLSRGFAPSNELTAEIQALVKQIKGSQQSPKTIDYVDGVPLTAVGKPDKKAVRARYWSGTDRSVG